jgi:exonuclease SbcC
VLDDAGVPVLPDTKVTAFDRWAERTFPPPEVLFSSVFSAQAGAGFLGAKPAERKATLLRVLGVEKLERLAEEARERARTQKATVATLAARLSDERARGGDAVALESALAEARREAAGADADAETARRELDAARAEAAAVGAAMQAHEAAASAYRAAEQARRDAAARLADLETRATGFRACAAGESSLAAELERTRSLLAQADQRIQARAAAVATSREALADARRQAAALAELEEQRAALQGRLDTATAKLSDLETRIRNNEAVLAERPAIEAAVSELARLQDEEQAARRDAAQADSDARVAAQQGEEALRAGDAQQSRALQERARVERLRLALSRAEEVEAAARCLPGLRRDVEATEAEIASAERVLEELRGRRLAGADERIDGLRQGLSRVIGAASAAPGARAHAPLQIATETLDADNAALRAAAEVPEAITLAAARVARARERAEKARAGLLATEATAALAERLDADRAALAEAEQAVAYADTAFAEAEQACASAVRQAATYRGARDGYLECAAALEVQAAQLRPLAAKAAPLANAESLLAERRPAAEAARAEVAGLMNELAALESRISGAARPDVDQAELAAASASESLATAELARAELADALPRGEERLGEARAAAARLEELEPQIAQTQGEFAQLDVDLAAGPPAPPPPPVDVAAFERAAAVAEGTARQVAQAVAVAESRLAVARESSERATALEAELAAAELDLADWTRLAADLGRDGLQAAVIDSAIPELNEHCNSLLHEAFGPRFTVDLRTQRLDAKGKREIESLDVIVIDTERGREAPAETLSGGERVIVQEALSLGLTAIACRSAGLTDVDLVRDETGAALDPEKAAQYVRMLRRAADLIGARHILFVSHNPDIQELADARIELASP